MGMGIEIQSIGVCTAWVVRHSTNPPQQPFVVSSQLHSDRSVSAINRRCTDDSYRTRCAVACVQCRWAGLEAAAAAGGGGGDAGRADGSCHGRVETVATVTG